MVPRLPVIEAIVPEPVEAQPEEMQLPPPKLTPPQPTETLAVEPPAILPEAAASRLVAKDVEALRPAIKRPPLAPSSKPAKETVEETAPASREQPAASPPPLPPLTPNKAPPLPTPSGATPSVAPPPLPSQTPATNGATPPPLPPAKPQDVVASTADTSPPPLRVASTIDNTNASTPTTHTTAALPVTKTPWAVQGYRPDRDKLASVYRLGLTLSLITLLEILPALWHALHPSAPYITLSGAPAWAQVVLMLCLLQMVYIVWMVSLPDWSTVWILMLIYGAVSAVYGFAFAVSLLTPRTQEMLLGLDIVRRPTPWWCAAMVLLTFLAAFLCGRTSSRWHRNYQATARVLGQ